jgi:hypothetical protein
VQGATGVQGLTGWTGAQGFTGSQGVQGWTGSQGATGSTGAQGFTGNQGSTGWTGAQGATGVQGSTGAQGAQGNTGTQGATGTQGPTGAQGAQGGLTGFIMATPATTLTNIAYTSNVGITSNYWYYATNVTMSNTTLTASNVTVTGVVNTTSRLMTGAAATITLFNSNYGSTYIISATNFLPIFGNGITTYPFYIFVKNTTASILPIAVSGSFATGPANCNLYPASSNFSGSGSLTILYGVSSTVWYLL